MDQEFIDQQVKKLYKLGSKRPLGFHYAYPFGKVTADSIQCKGMYVVTKGLSNGLLHQSKVY